jgi:hypothetical protein
MGWLAVGQQAGDVVSVHRWPGWILGTVSALLAAAAAPALARQPDPIPPPAPPISDAVALSRIPSELMAEPGLQLVLDRRTRQLMVLKDGRLLHRYPAAVGTDGWETPAGRHQVLEKVAHPIWEHPGDGRQVPSGAQNPLGWRALFECGGLHGCRLPWHTPPLDRGPRRVPWLRASLRGKRAGGVRARADRHTSDRASVNRP